LAAFLVEIVAGIAVVDGVVFLLRGVFRFFVRTVCVGRIDACRIDASLNDASLTDASLTDVSLTDAFQKCVFCQKLRVHPVYRVFYNFRNHPRPHRHSLL